MASLKLGRIKKCDKETPQILGVQLEVLRTRGSIKGPMGVLQAKGCMDYGLYYFDLYTPGE